MDKYSLRWNQFQSSVTDSFRTFRREEVFHDVTLVSEDEVQMKSHRFLLSACSSFFQRILRSTDHNQPLIYLNGVPSKQLGLVLDYIYQGEVKIFQDQLDEFLAVASKLRIEGLVNTNTAAGNRSEAQPNSSSSLLLTRGNVQVRKPANKRSIPDGNATVKEEDTNEYEVSYNEVATIPSFQPKDDSPKILTNEYSQNIGADDLNAKTTELIKKNDDNTFSCNVCGHVATVKQHMKYHVETHIEGLQYNCAYCDKTFRLQRSLFRHIKGHRNSIEALYSSPSPLSFV